MKYRFQKEMVGKIRIAIKELNSKKDQIKEEIFRSSKRYNTKSADMN